MAKQAFRRSGLALPGGIAGVAWAAVGALLVWVLALYGRYALGALNFPFGLDYSEGLIWQQVLWTPGPHMYGDISHYPFVVFEYPPLYLLAVKALAGCGMGMLAAGRLISIGAALVTCAMAGLIVWRVSRLHADPPAATLAGLLAGCLPLTLLPILSWSVLMRVDTLALALTFLGLWFALLALRRPGFLYAAVLAFVAAAFTKQIYLAGAISVALVWLVRAPRQAILAYGAGGALALALIGLLEWQTAGGFLRHVILYNVDRLNIGVAWTHTLAWLAAYPVFAALVPLSIALCWRRAAAGLRAGALLAAVRRDERCACLAILTLHAVLTSALLISAGKIGASRNYFMEWMGDWCLWLGLLAGLIGTSGLFARLLPLLLLLQLWPVPAGLATLRAGQFSATRRSQDAALLQRVRGLTGPILSDDMVLVIQSGREVGMEPGILLELAGTGLWREQTLIDMLDARKFAAIVTAYGPGDPTFAARYLPRTQMALQQDYRVAEQFGDYRLLLPR